jgi:hypothetical protein
VAKSEHNLEVVPLQALGAGQIGAPLYLASVCCGDLRQVDHLVVELGMVDRRSKSTETERHRLALSQAPEAFARQHMAQLALEAADGGKLALFYTVLPASRSSASGPSPHRNGRAGGGVDAGGHDAGLIGDGRHDAGRADQ